MGIENDVWSATYDFQHRSKICDRHTIHGCLDRDETNPVSPYTIEQRRWTLGQTGTLNIEKK